MSSTDRTESADPSLDALEARSEHLRSGLADTVGELRSRLSPETIKADVKDSIVQSGQDMLAKLERSARENPLQTAAIGAGLAYPVIGILRSIPAPILLMGAGVALSGRNNIFSGLLSSDKVAGAVTAGSDKASGLAGKASDTASAAAASVTSRAQSVTDDVTDAVSAASASVTGTVSDATQGISDAAGAAAQQARMAYHDATHAVGDATERAAALGRQGRDTLVDTVQRNPLLVGALTALAGAALATLIPHSRTESRLLGDSSARVRERAKSAAQEGLHAAMDAGERVVASTVEAARDEGLEPEAGKEAIRDLGERATAVVEAGMKAIVPDDGPSDESEGPTGEGRRNPVPHRPLGN
ncbi:hypothetical protein [Aureimonas glaciei]|uniref:DUF3618 domain-containing protein n=1 Tax=Aureimonas glaciei TaxID=1776957 RepID=A0A916XW15_9HYPH|nr:hypothetical protein [Aureimonas glaciei]GGD16101.1 hypothetical protein GCM10011335_18570 [Aureimonas glaciei]